MRGPPGRHRRAPPQPSPGRRQPGRHPSDAVPSRRFVGPGQRGKQRVIHRQAEVVDLADRRDATGAGDEPRAERAQPGGIDLDAPRRHTDRGITGPRAQGVPDVITYLDHVQPDTEQLQVRGVKPGQVQAETTDAPVPDLHRGEMAVAVWRGSTQPLYRGGRAVDLNAPHGSPGCHPTYGIDSRPHHWQPFSPASNPRSEDTRLNSSHVENSYAVF